MRSRNWPRCRGRNCARSAPGLSRTSRRRSCATYCWRILQSARTPGPANPSPVEGPFGSAGARGELPPDHCGEEILDSSDKRGVDALVRHAGHDIELHCDAVASEAVVKTLDPFDARSAAVVGSRYPLWPILGHGDFPGLRVVGYDDHLNGNPAQRGEIGLHPEFLAKVPRSDPPGQGGIEERDPAGRTDRGRRNATGMKIEKAVDELPAAGKSMDQKAAHVHRVALRDLLHHGEQHPIEADVVELDELVVIEIAPLDDSAGEQRREHNAAVALGEIDELLSIALRAASAAVDGDHQGMLGILFLAARRHIKAIGEALVEAAREHGRLAALVERKRAGSSGAWSHDYFSGGRVYASRNRSRQPNQAPGSS